MLGVVSEGRDRDPVKEGREFASEFVKFLVPSLVRNQDKRKR